MKKDELNLLISIIKLNGSVPNTEIKSLIKNMDDFDISIKQENINYEGKEVGIIIVKRSSNYKQNESHYEIALSEKLGSGKYGNIFKSDLLLKVNSAGEVYHISNSSKAIKLIKKQNDKKIQNEQIKNETYTINQLYPNMNKSKEVRKGRGHLVKLQNDYEAAIILPFIQGVDFFEFYHEQWESIGYKERVIIAANLVAAVDDFHKLTKKVHQDIKVENIIINPETLEVKLVDFGFAEDVGSNFENIRGNIQGTAPEKFKRLNGPDSLELIQDYFSLAGLLAFIFGADFALLRVDLDQDQESMFDEAESMPYIYLDLLSGFQSELSPKQLSDIETHIKKMGAMDPNDRTSDLEDVRKCLENIALLKNSEINDTKYVVARSFTEVPQQSCKVENATQLSEHGLFSYNQQNQKALDCTNEIVAKTPS